MSTHRIRTTLIAVVVSIGVAAPTLAAVPAAHATKNTGAFWTSGAAAKARYCDQLFDQFQYHVDQAGDADHAGKAATMKAHLKDATAFLHDAQNLGCDWA